MCFGGNNSPPPAPHYPDVPPPEELMDVIDKVTGTQAITVIGPDGKKRRVVERLPRTPEEERLYDQAGELMTRAITEIQTLNAYDPSAAVDFAPFIETMNTLNQERQGDMAELTRLPDFNGYVQNFKDMNKKILEEDFKRQENENREYLNRRGYSDSTAAVEMRNSLGRQRAEALEQSHIKGDVIGEELKAADLANRQNMFSFREQGRMGQLQKSQMEHQLKVDQMNQMNAARQQALQNQNNLFQIGAGIRGEDANRAMASRAPDLANTIFQQNNMDSLNRHNARINQMNAQYQNQMAQYQATPPSFGDTMLNLGGTALGAGFGGMMGGPPGMMAGGSFGSNLRLGGR